MTGSGPFQRRHRVAITGAVAACCFVTLLTRLVHLQVAERPAYAARAEANRLRVVPPRGSAPQRKYPDKQRRLERLHGKDWRGVSWEREIPQFASPARAPLRQETERSLT